MVFIKLYTDDYGSVHNNNSAAWRFAHWHDKVFFDGERLYKAFQEMFWTPEGYSDDGLRKTGGCYRDGDYRPGSVFKDVPEEILATCRQALWDHEHPEEAARRWEESLDKPLTFVGKTAAKREWLAGIKVDKFPSHEELMEMAREGLEYDCVRVKARKGRYNG